jgi:hypothetical protein
MEHTEKMNNERMPKQIVTARMERKSEGERPLKKCSGEV